MSTRRFASSTPAGTTISTSGATIVTAEAGAGVLAASTEDVFDADTTGDTESTSEVRYLGPLRLGWLLFRSVVTSPGSRTGINRLSGEIIDLAQKVEREG